MSTSFLYLLVILSIATAAAPEKKEFSISSFFEGSWIIASRQLNLETGDIVNDVSFIQYNITKTDENEYDIYPLEKNSYLRDRNANQVVLITSSQLTAEVKKYDIERDEFELIGEFKFASMLPHESYMSTGVSPFNEQEEYELTTFAENHFTLKFINRAENLVTIYSATRVIIPPPLTFMQKYGMSILMAAMILIQMGVKAIFGNGPIPENKPKTD